MRYAYFCCLALCLIYLTLFTKCGGTPYGIDTSFGTEGKVTLDFAGGDDGIEVLLLDTDGRVLGAGSAASGTHTDFAIIRYNADGTADTNFDSDGKQTTDFGHSTQDKVYAMALQSDGKIVVGGSSTSGSTTQMALARYLTNGSLDTSFDTDGKKSFLNGSGPDEIYSIAIATDGNYLLGGKSQASSKVYATILRTSSDGVLDTTFNTTGVRQMTWSSSESVVKALSIKRDGKILAAGQGVNATRDFVVTRLNTDGSPDTSFGIKTLDPGLLFGDSAASSAETFANLHVGRSREIFLTGYTNYSGREELAVIKLDENGTIDSTFGISGIATASFVYKDSKNGVHPLDARAYASMMDSDNSVYVAGNAGDTPVSEMALSHFFDTGRIDSFLATDGRALISYSAAQDEARALLIQSDGKLLLGGRTYGNQGWDFALMRYIP